MNAKHLLITTSLAAALFFVGSAAGNSYRVFYYVCGEKREKPYHGSIEANSACEVRSIILAEEPKAINIEVNRMAGVEPDCCPNAKEAR